MIEPEPARTLGLRTRFSAVAAAIAGLGLATNARLAFASFPFDRQHDEPLLVRGALAIASTGDLRPPVPSWGTLPFYGLALLYRVAHGTAALLGLERFPLDPDLDEHYAAARIVSLLLVATATFLAAHVGRRAFGELCGWISAGLLALAPLAAELAGQAVVDPWVLAAAVASLLAALRISAGDTAASSYALGGACAGLAAACKITGGFALVALLAAHALARPRPPSSRIALAIFVCGVAFALANPHALLEPQGILDGMAFEREHYSQEYLLLSRTSATSWGTYAKVLTRETLGPGGVLLLLAGLALGARLEPRRTLVLVSSAALLFLVVGSFRLPMRRQVLAALPAVCVLGALPCARVLDALRGRRSTDAGLGRPALRWAWIGLVALVPTGFRLVQRSAELLATRLPDTRTELLAWLDANVPDGASVLREADTPRTDALGERCSVRLVRGVVFAEARAPAARADFLVVHAHVRDRIARLSAHFPREAALYDELFNRCRPLATFAASAGAARGPTFWVFGALPADLRERFEAP